MHVPVIKFGDQVIHCEEGENLRRVLMRSKAPLYNGMTKVVNDTRKGDTQRYSYRTTIAYFEFRPKRALIMHMSRLHVPVWFLLLFSQP